MKYIWFFFFAQSDSIVFILIQRFVIEKRRLFYLFEYVPSIDFFYYLCYNYRNIL